MKKEIKEEKSKAGVITAVVVAIAVIAGGIMLLKSNKTDTTIQKTETVVATKAEPKKEKTIARISFITKLDVKETNPFEIIINDSKISEKPAEWLKQQGNFGYVVQNNKGSIDVIIKSNSDSDININLRGRRDIKDGQAIKHWVKYTSLNIDSEDVLTKPTTVWLGNLYSYVLRTQKGKEYKLHIEWTKADK